MRMVYKGVLTPCETHYLVDIDTPIMWLEQFSFGIIGIALNNSRYFLIKSEVIPKPVETRSHKFSRALRQLSVITWNTDWFTGLSAFLVIGQSDYFGSTTLSWRPLFKYD